jgi:hypothetical protein
MTPDVQGDIGWTGAYDLGDGTWAAAVAFNGRDWERPSNLTHLNPVEAVAEAGAILETEFGPQYPTESDLL